MWVGRLEGAGRLASIPSPLSLAYYDNAPELWLYIALWAIAKMLAKIWPQISVNQIVAEGTEVVMVSEQLAF